MKISVQRIAGVIMIISFSCMCLFHILVLTGIIPYTMVWGGSLESQSYIFKMEIVSLLLTIIFLLIVLSRMKSIKMPLGERSLRILLWIVCGFFLLNTLGNIVSVNKWERQIFTPLTLILAACAAVLARSK